MLIWRANITHLSIVLAQPIYLIIQLLRSHDHARLWSPLGLTIHALVWQYIVRKITIPFFNNPLRWVPSPPKERFLINHLNFHRAPPTTLLEDMVNNTPNDGLIALWGPLYLGCEILPTRPDTIVEMLNTHNYDWEKPSFTRDMLEKSVGLGLINVEGADHKSMRRAVNPAFGGHNIRALASLFFEKGVALTDWLAVQAQQSEDGVVEIASHISRITLDIIGVAGVGRDLDTLHNKDSPLAKLYEAVMHPPMFSLLIDTFIPTWLLGRLTGTAYATTVKARSDLKREVRSMMQEKKADIKEGRPGTDNKDIVGRLMTQGGFTDDYLVGQMLTFLAAGHDTTASSLMWAAWLLSTRHEVQDHLRNECQSRLSQSDNTEIDAAIFDPESMPYLDAVCNETLRLYPPVPVTPRQAVVPTTLAGVRIPKGTLAVIGPWAVNRSRVLWGDDADHFKPDRWLGDSNEEPKNQYKFLTFSHGPRSCIGKAFAVLEMKCLLATLVTRFKFELAEVDPKLEIEGYLTIKPKGGVRLKLHDLGRAGT